jgi:hypothetical protein
MLITLVRSRLIDNAQTERIALIQKTNGSLSQSLGLSADGTKWLEEKLGRTLEQIFCRPKVLDISKLAREPSRYFSLWLDKHNTCMFFSASAVRRSLASLDRSTDLSSSSRTLFTWQPVFDQLHKIQDWTSKDLLSIVASYDF